MRTQPPEMRYAQAQIDGLVLHLYFVWFYGLYGANRDKVAVVRRQLQELNEHLAG